MSARDNILATFSDLMGRFLYYDRKEDGGLPVGAIGEALRTGVVTEDELVRELRAALRRERNNA